MIKTGSKGTAKGFYKFTKSKADTGIITYDGPWIPNLITDAGLDYMGNNNNYLSWCQVGSDAGSSLPLANNNTALGAKITGAHSNILNGSAVIANAQDGGQWYTAVTKTFRFDAGVATGTVAEVGVGWANTGSLFSRAIVTPSAITVLADEVLDVTYEFRYYVPTADDNGSVVLNGVTYYYLSRAAEADNTAYWSNTASGKTQGLVNGILTYSGGLGAITALPTSASGTGGTNVVASYVGSSYSRSLTATWGLSQGNAAGGIGAIGIRFGIGGYQVGFYESDLTTLKPIPKTASNTLNLTFSYSWGRRP